MAIYSKGWIEGLAMKVFISVAYHNHKNNVANISRGSKVLLSQIISNKCEVHAVLSSNKPTVIHINWPSFKKLYQDHGDNISRVGLRLQPSARGNLPIIKNGAKVSGEGGTGA